MTFREAHQTSKLFLSVFSIVMLICLNWKFTKNFRKSFNSVFSTYADKQCSIPFFKLIDFCALDVCLLLVFNSLEEKEAAFLAKKKALTNDISRLEELYEGFMAKFPHLRFEYR